MKLYWRRVGILVSTDLLQSRVGLNCWFHVISIQSSGKVCNITKILKAKIKSKAGYTEAEANNNVVWLMETLEDIMVNFEEIKPNIFNSMHHKQFVIRRSVIKMTKDYKKL